MAWWHSLWSGLGPAEAYEASCACGQPVRGTRRRQSQAVPCPVCGRRVFVLARSPFGQPQANGKKLAKSRPLRQRSLSWGVPVLVGIGLLIALVAGFLFVLPQLGRAPAPVSVDDAVDRARAHFEAGREALDEGRFERALRELSAAAALRDTRPSVFTSATSRQLTLLHRQSTLLAHLLGRSLQEIVQEAALVRDVEEWKERFAQNYRGKSVVFDDTIRRDAAGRPVFSVYVVRVGEDQVRVALEDLTVLRNVPLDPPQRLLFGGHLAAVEHERGGTWVVRFQPDSGVLLTDPAAVPDCYPRPLDDELLAHVWYSRHMFRGEGEGKAVISVVFAMSATWRAEKRSDIIV